MASATTHGIEVKVEPVGRSLFSRTVAPVISLLTFRHCSRARTTRQTQGRNPQIRSAECGPLHQNYLDEGVRLLELAKRAAELFRKQTPHEQRKLLNFVLSNCTWANGTLSVTYRQPFDMLAETVTNAQNDNAADCLSGNVHPVWRPQPDSKRLQGVGNGQNPSEFREPRQCEETDPGMLGDDNAEGSAFCLEADGGQSRSLLDLTIEVWQTMARTAEWEAGHG